MFSYRVDEDIILQLPEERHAEEVTALVRENLAHLREWLPWARENFSADDSMEFIRRARRQFAENQALFTHIVYRGQHAGNIGYNHLDWANRTTEIGYWLAASFQGKGIMTRACRALVDHAFGEFKLNRVSIHCGLGNTKSRAVPERLGFKQEGVLRQAEWLHDHFTDLVVYSMLAEEWAGTGGASGGPGE